MQTFEVAKGKCLNLAFGNIVIGTVDQVVKDLLFEVAFN